MASQTKKFKVPSESEITLKNGFFREMQTKDLSDVYQLMKQHLSQFKMFPHYTQEDIGHLLLPKDKVVYTYVVESEIDEESKESKKTHKITDLVSFYRLPT
jgi:glycylpeptide N-tetradecanoyltransferase